MDRYVPPHGLDGPVVTGGPDRRVQLADWLTAPENPFFARAIVKLREHVPMLVFLVGILHQKFQR